MKRALATAAVAVLATSSAMAADLGTKKPSPVPVFTAFSWTGAYVGVDAGYSFGRGTFNVPALVAAVANPEPSGFTIGGHAGYRYQLRNNIVLGAEVRAFANIGTRNSKRVGAFANLAEAEHTWGGDARLSVGYAMNRFLVYAAGGLALHAGDGCATLLAGPPCIAGSTYKENGRIGWTIGAGLGYAVTNNLIARLDYSYASFANKNYTTPFVVGGITRVKLETHAVRAGLSYKF